MNLQDNKLHYLPKNEIVIYIHIMQFQNSICKGGPNQVPIPFKRYARHTQNQYFMPLSFIWWF